MDNDTLLGWLINPQDRQVEIYRQLECGRVGRSTGVAMPYKGSRNIAIAH